MYWKAGIDVVGCDYTERIIHPNSSCLAGESWLKVDTPPKKTPKLQTEALLSSSALLR